MAILLVLGFSQRVHPVQVVDVELKAGIVAMLFAGKKLKEPLAWHDPMVMNTQDQIQATFVELCSGQFPPKHVSYDYKRLSARPVRERSEL